MPGSISEILSQPSLSLAQPAGGDKSLPQKGQSIFEPYGSKVSQGNVFRFGGQNAVVADQASTNQANAEGRVEALSKEQYALTRQLNDKRAELERDERANRFGYGLDLASLGEKTQELRERRKKMESVEAELEGRRKDLEELKNINLTAAKEYAKIAKDALTMNLVPQEDRLKMNKPDNIVAGSYGRSIFAF